ncbi:MAG TPA: NapC/NirT family cytochrome c [Syntrophales bacterium]|nr:NapC/NirT family cytochrome c [Syntrophales bacterium]
MPKANNIMGYFFNVVSLIGMLLAIVATGLIIIFLSLEAMTGVEHPYLGVLVYFIFPAMLILGLFLVPIGAFQVRQQRRKLAPEEIPPYPDIDLNDQRTRNLFVFFILGTVVFVIIIALAAIKGYHFTESTNFCGKLCHTVMTPEYTAWSKSPHARVQCVECHIGPGAKWYVKAKISGLKQIYAVLAHTYSIPIETPITNLRPARDICERCHWPEQFYSGRQKVYYHYAPDEKNTPREINLLINVGGTPKTPTAMGIHWHIGREVYYIARDRKRLDLPYVAVKDKYGKITEYQDVDNPLSKEEIAKGAKRLMDCTDCHNRPTHIYRSPGQEMDEHFVSGHIDPSLPYIKKIAVELLNKPYKSKEEGRNSIVEGVEKYYAKNYPRVAKEKAPAIEQAIEKVQDIYSRNYFPGMKVRWNTYPNHISHFYSPGCFRCHGGRHKSTDGKIISKDCNLCHTVLSQKQENIKPGSRAKGFIHPTDIGDAIIAMNCSDCHSEGGEDIPGGGKK